MSLIFTASEQPIAGHNPAQYKSVFSNGLGTVPGAVWIHGATVSVYAGYMVLIKFDRRVGVGFVFFTGWLGANHFNTRIQDKNA